MAATAELGLWCIYQQNTSQPWYNYYNFLEWTTTAYYLLLISCCNDAMLFIDLNSIATVLYEQAELVFFFLFSVINC